MTPEELNNRLGAWWGASLTVVMIDLAHREAVLGLRLPLPDGTDREVQLRFEGVTIFKVGLRPGAAWAYTEATSMALVSEGAELSFDVVLWDEPDQLAIRCSSVTIEEPGTKLIQVQPA